MTEEEKKDIQEESIEQDVVYEDIQEATSDKSIPESKVSAKIIIGVVFVFLGVAAVIGWWSDLWVIVRGLTGIILLIAGAVTIAIAKD